MIHQNTEVVHLNDAVIRQYNNDLRIDLEAFCQQCAAEGLVNNSNLKRMKLENTLDNDGMFWLVYYGNEKTPGSVCGIERFRPPEGLWPEEELNHTFRVGFRQATLQKFRGRHKQGLLGGIQENVALKHIFPLSFVWGLSRGARRFVATTNSGKSRTHDISKMYQMDTVMKTYFQRKGYVSLLRSDVEIFGTLQNLWEVLPPRWYGHEENYLNGAFSSQWEGHC